MKPLPSKQNFIEAYTEKIQIIFENNNFLVLEKPTGLACHGPDAENLADILVKHKIPAFLCHRLDKETSGLLLIAKTPEVADDFRQLFESNIIEKYYLALCDKKGKKKQGSIKGNIEKSRNGNWKLSFSDNPKTVTQFFSFSFPINEISSRAFIIKIIGGKTHQIRVALKSNSSPVMGDVRYGGLPYTRLCLHAYALRFTFQNEAFCFLSEASFLEGRVNELNNIFENSSSPWNLAWPKV